MPIIPNFDGFDQTPQFLAHTPNERTRLIKALNTHFIRKTLLGDYG